MDKNKWIAICVIVYILSMVAFVWIDAAYKPRSVVLDDCIDYRDYRPGDHPRCIVFPIEEPK